MVKDKNIEIQKNVKQNNKRHLQHYSRYEKKKKLQTHESNKNIYRAPKNQSKNLGDRQASQMSIVDIMIQMNV
jgi:uncharacterized protein YijF (DUF1287 family)